MIFALTAPLIFHANAAQAAPVYISEYTLYDYATQNPQKLKVSASSAPPTLTRDSVTIIDPPPLPPSPVYNGRSIGNVNGDIVATAKQYIGLPYVANSADPNVGFDCSGFVMHVFAQLGVSLPHNANVQGQLGTVVPMSEAIPGDLLVWEGHVAIYVGNGMMIDSAKPGTTVNIRPIWGNPYVSRLT